MTNTNYLKTKADQIISSNWTIIIEPVVMIFKIFGGNSSSSSSPSAPLNDAVEWCDDTVDMEGERTNVDTFPVVTL